MSEKTLLGQLLQVVGNIGAEIAATHAQFARGELFVTDIVQKQCLNWIDVQGPRLVEPVPDHVEQSAVKSLDECQCLAIGRADLIDGLGVYGGLSRQC